MKNVKLKVLSGLVAASIFIPALSVSAEEVTPSTSPKLGVAREKIQEHKNSDEWQQRKASVTAKKDTIKQNYQTNKTLREEIAGKKTTIENLKNTLKQNTKQLSEEDLSKIKAQLETIKTDSSQLTALKGDIKTDFQTIKDDIKNKNFDDAEAQLDNVISIQNTRTTDLKKLSADLDSLITLLQTTTSTGSI